MIRLVTTELKQNNNKKQKTRRKQIKELFFYDKIKLFVYILTQNTK